MAHWGNVKYVVRVRPDLDHGSTDNCNDSVEDYETAKEIDDEGMVVNSRPEKRGFSSFTSESQISLTRTGSVQNVFLSVPGETPWDRQNVCSSPGISRTSSLTSIKSGVDIRFGNSWRRPSDTSLRPVPVRELIKLQDDSRNGVDLFAAVQVREREKKSPEISRKLSSLQRKQLSFIGSYRIDLL